MHPKVFVSHASEDKERFVVEFATRLRSTGIDAWLDRWEMLPGDSLVDKIFEEGVRQASAVIVVLSKHSVVKPWVREELNAAFVKRVNAGSKLIPIVLDECEIPEALKSTLWERIADTSSYDESFNRIIAAITGTREKPPLGSLPGYVTSPIRDIGGLARVDNLVLKTACELAMARGNDLVNGPKLVDESQLAGIPPLEIKDSIEILGNENLVSILKMHSADLPHFRITTYGFQEYGKAYIDDYEQKINHVALTIVNHGLKDNRSLSSHLNENQFLVDHALDVLDSNGYLRLTKTVGGQKFILDVSAKLRRALS